MDVFFPPITDLLISSLRKKYLSISKFKIQYMKFRNSKLFNTKANYTINTLLRSFCYLKFKTFENIKIFAQNKILFLCNCELMNKKK